MTINKKKIVLVLAGLITTTSISGMILVAVIYLNQQNNQKIYRDKFELKIDKNNYNGLASDVKEQDLKISYNEDEYKIDTKIVGINDIEGKLFVKVSIVDKKNNLLLKNQIVTIDSFAKFNKNTLLQASKAKFSSFDALQKYFKDINLSQNYYQLISGQDNYFKINNRPNSLKIIFEKITKENENNQEVIKLKYYLKGQVQEDKLDYSSQKVITKTIKFKDNDNSSHFEKSLLATEIIKIDIDKSNILVDADINNLIAKSRKLLNKIKNDKTLYSNMNNENSMLITKVEQLIKDLSVLRSEEDAQKKQNQYNTLFNKYHQYLNENNKNNLTSLIKKLKDYAEFQASYPKSYKLLEAKIISSQLAINNKASDVYESQIEKLEQAYKVGFNNDKTMELEHAKASFKLWQNNARVQKTYQEISSKASLDTNEQNFKNIFEENKNLQNKSIDDSTINAKLVVDKFNELIIAYLKLHNVDNSPLKNLLTEVKKYLQENASKNTLANNNWEAFTYNTKSLNDYITKYNSLLINAQNNQEINNATTELQNLYQAIKSEVLNYFKDLFVKKLSFDVVDKNKFASSCIKSDINSINDNSDQFELKSFRIAGANDEKAQVFIEAAITNKVENKEFTIYKQIDGFTPFVLNEYIEIQGLNSNSALNNTFEEFLKKAKQGLTTPLTLQDQRTYFDNLKSKLKPLSLNLSLKNIKLAKNQSKGQINFIVNAKGKIILDTLKNNVLEKHFQEFSNKDITLTQEFNKAYNVNFDEFLNSLNNKYIVKHKSILTYIEQLLKFNKIFNISKNSQLNKQTHVLFDELKTAYKDNLNHDDLINIANNLNEYKNKLLSLENSALKEEYLFIIAQFEAFLKDEKLEKARNKKSQSEQNDFDVAKQKLAEVKDNLEAQKSNFENNLLESLIGSNDLKTKIEKIASTRLKIANFISEQYLEAYFLSNNMLIQYDIYTKIIESASLIKKYYIKASYFDDLKAIDQILDIKKLAQKFVENDDDKNKAMIKKVANSLFPHYKYILEIIGNTKNSFIENHELYEDNKMKYKQIRDFALKLSQESYQPSEDDIENGLVYQYVYDWLNNYDQYFNNETNSFE